MFINTEIYEFVKLTDNEAWQGEQMYLTYYLLLASVPKPFMVIYSWT